MVYKFASTSKVTVPGSGIVALASSLNNLEYIKKQLSVQTIGHDKVNQLRHVRFFKDINGLVEHMKKHADILRPKFEAVEEILEEELGGLGIAKWTTPKGGYFMCGIVGYNGPLQAAPILLDGLSKLEYRGYDSAGLSVRNGEKPAEIVKAKGRLKALSAKTNGGKALKGTCGIGHTRWATHGEPSENNAHPHQSLLITIIKNTTSAP